MPTIKYSAVVLDEDSRTKLLTWAHDKFPTIKRDGWEVIAHHMTITMGELPNYLKKDIGETQTLEVNGYGSSTKVFAVRVSGYYTKNKTPHITIAVNRKVGAKPVMSNELGNWQPVMKPFTVKGVVTEIK
jgi:hypothetical protein